MIMKRELNIQGLSTNIEQFILSIFTVLYLLILEIELRYNCLILIKKLFENF